MINTGKTFYDQPIDSDIKRYEEIKKLATEKGEDYTTGCLLDYGYTKKHYRLIAIDLSREMKLDADPKVFQQIHYVRIWKIKKTTIIHKIFETNSSFYVK